MFGEGVRAAVFDSKATGRGSWSLPGRRADRGKTYKLNLSHQKESEKTQDGCSSIGCGNNGNYGIGQFISIFKMGDSGAGKALIYFWAADERDRDQSAPCSTATLRLQATA